MKQASIKGSRDFKIDFLRAFSIILIVMAHAKTEHDSSIIFQLRSFDVPLMCMLVGMTAFMSLERKKEKYIPYLIKRFQRLIPPMWVFITLYLVFALINKLMFAVPFPSVVTIATSYVPIWGIGYVWIIRVYFIIAIVAPLLHRIAMRVTKLLPKIIIISTMLGIQQILCWGETVFSGFSLSLYRQLIPISFGYLLIALVGMWTVHQNETHTLILGLLSGTLFLILMSVLGIGTLTAHKYPPDVYYLSYGLAISLLLYYFLGKLHSLSGILGSKPIFWISASSLEIYYWHVFFVETINRVFGSVHWSARFVLVMVVTMTVAWVQLRFFPSFFKADFICRFRRRETISKNE